MRLIFAPIAFIAMAWPVCAAEQTVWQIGKFDQSSEEFAEVQPDHIIFRIDHDDWHNQWPRYQPARKPYEIDFAIAGSPSGIYVLSLSLLTYSPRIPTVHVHLNGRSGAFYLQPKLTYVFGDGQFAFDPHYSITQLNIELPASYFQSGDNKLTFEPVDDPPSNPPRDDISGIAYDAVRLAQDSSRNTQSISSTASVTPTILYKQHGHDLLEVVEAIVRLPGNVSNGKVVLEVGGHEYEAALSFAHDFGEQRFDFEVPQWAGEAPAKLIVDTNPKRAFDFRIRPARQWKIFVVPHTHLDIGYTDFQGKVAETQARVLSQAEELIRKHPDFRFSMDGSWNLEQLLETRSEAKQNKIINLIRQGKMSLPAQYCNLLTGYASLETLYRSLYFSKAFARRYDLPLEYANITDVPSYSGAYPSVLASSGVKYWAAASNNDRAPVFVYARWNSKSPFWWEGPDGKKVLFWYSRHYEQVQTLFGLPPDIQAVRESLPIYLQAFSTPEYKPDVALLYGTQVENTDLFPSTATFVPQWNDQYAYPKLEYKTFSDFFHYMESNYGSNLPTYKGDGGPYWEDGIGSDAFYVAQDRENQNRALSAEIISSVTHSFQPDLHPDKTNLNDIWRNIVLFAEHTWTSWNSVSQPDHVETIEQLEVKDSRASKAALEIRDAINRSMSQLANQIHVPAHTLVVFNSLNWKRDAVVETDLDENTVLEDLTTHHRVLYQVLAQQEHFIRARFLAEDLLPVGYKCYSISHAQTGPASDSIPIDGNTIENAYYRLTVDPASGAVSSIYDKELHRDLVDANSPYKFGQYLYVSGGEGTSMIHPLSTLPKAHLAIDRSTEGQLVSGSKATVWPFDSAAQPGEEHTTNPNGDFTFRPFKKDRIYLSCAQGCDHCERRRIFCFPSRDYPASFRLCNPARMD